MIIGRHRVALLVTLAACGPPPAECPYATTADDPRARALLATARSTRAGANLPDAAPTICFGDHGRGTVRHDGVIVLAAAQDHPAAAARLLHMHMHLVDELHRFPRPDIPCDRQLAAVIDAEARAIAAEIEACAELRCLTAPYSFADAVLAAAPSERPALVREKLHATPATDDLDVLIADYCRRCEDQSP